MSGGTVWLLFGAFASFVVVAVALSLPSGVVRVVLGVALSTVSGLLLVFRPRPWTLAWGAIGIAGVTVIATGAASNAGWFSVVILCLWIAMSGSQGRDGIAVWIGVVLVFAVEWAWIAPDPGWAAWIGGATFALTAGLVIRREMSLVAELRAAQSDLAARARDEERNRIARELHDIIAHSLTVALLHIGSARLAVSLSPSRAIDELAEAERLARQSLDEVRSTVGLMRTDAPGEIQEPLPGVKQLPTLIEGFRATGMTIYFDRHGEHGDLAATTELAIFRIAQESLTNAARHAPGAPVFVDLSVDITGVRLVVDSAGEPRTGSGNGLVSMRERAELLGGTCAAGPGTGSNGWRVAATIPILHPRTGTGASE